MAKLSSTKICYAVGLISIFSFFLYQNYASGAVTKQEKTTLTGTLQTAGSTAVGKTGDNIITTEELEKRIFLELQPDPYGIYTGQTKQADANSILLQMLGEKALVADARKQGLLNDDTAQKTIKDFKQQQILKLWVSDNLSKVKDKIAATDEEIDKLIKENPKVEREKAKSSIQAEKANKIMDQIYGEVYKKSAVKILKENFQKVIEIHNRLLTHPVKPDPLKIIREYQVKDELKQEEKNIVLATFNHGKITLKDWFETLCDFSPPSRPQNLDDKGVEQILDNVLTKQIIVADAQNIGLDKNAALVKQVSEYEDGILLNNIREKKYKEVKEPAKDEILAFYNKNKNAFTTNRILIIDQIWCKNSETAKKVKSALTSGRPFDEVKKEYSLFPESQAFNASPGTEGLFWDTLWAGEPNNIIGPIKGFRTDGIKWRIVKIMEKQPGKEEALSPNIENNIKYFIMGQQGNKLFADACREGLKKHTYEIYSDKIKDIDPMNIQ